MANRRPGSPTERKYRIDGKRYSDLLKQTRAAAKAALDQYGEPAVSLAALRSEVDAQLDTQSLSAWLIEERYAR